MKFLKTALMASTVYTVFLGWFSSASAYVDCSGLKSQYDDAANKNSAARSAYLYATDYARYSQLKAVYDAELSRWVTIENDYNACLSQRQAQAKQASDIFQAAYEAFEMARYDEAATGYEKFISLVNDPSDENYKSARYNLRAAYFNLAYSFYQKADYKSARPYFDKSLAIDSRDEKTLYWAWINCISDKDPDSAIKYFKSWLISTWNPDWISQFQKGIIASEALISVNKEVASAPTNDRSSGFQYYLKWLNVPSAWSKVSNNLTVTVAVIDDGVNVNHPDLVGRIWTNSREIPGNGKDDDGNGFIDDYNGWNFASDNYVNLVPSWSHGTMVSGIIAANANNGVGIAGIAKNAQIMPLRVMEFANNGWSSSRDSVIKAMNYAVDNGADIINLSLGWHQWAYSNDFDEVVAKAYRKWIPVVVAAGNGDVLSRETSWVNTSVNRISPVCNSGMYPKSVIGVAAYGKDNGRALWSNYGKCAPFGAYWVGIVSTSVRAFSADGASDYEYEDGTSFAAPQITGVIALGMSQYGKLSPDEVYDSLVFSMSQNGIIDALKFMDSLAENRKYAKLKKAVDSYFAKIKRKYGAFGTAWSKERLKSLKSAVQGLSISGEDKRYVQTYLVNQISIELTR